MISLSVSVYEEWTFSFNTKMDKHLNILYPEEDRFKTHCQYYLL